MSDPVEPSIAVLVTERDLPLAQQLDARLGRVQTVTLPAPASELDYVSIFETAATAAHQITTTGLRGVFLASSGAEALLGVEAVADLCADLTALTSAPAVGLLALYKKSLKRLGISRPVLLSTFDWPLTLMVRSEFLREGMLIPHMARLTSTGPDVSSLSDSAVAELIRSNVTSDCDGVLLVGEDVRVAGARQVLGDSIPVPLLSSVDLVAAEAERLLAHTSGRGASQEALR